jgi:hypothetical protein
MDDPQYVASLGQRRRRELWLCCLLLEPDELRTQSSIVTAFRIARERYVYQYVEAGKFKRQILSEKKKVPCFFSKFDVKYYMDRYSNPKELLLERLGRKVDSPYQNDTENEIL